MEGQFSPGNTVTATVCVARDGSNKGWAREFVLAGKTFYDAACEPK